MAFWSPMSWDDPQRFLTKDDGLPKTPAKGRWRDVIQGARDKGPKFGNYSGWRVGNLLKTMDAVLVRDRPEAAIIMIGTNDISGNRVPAGYRAGLESVIAKCLKAHCVPILNTIPPRRGHDTSAKEINQIIRALALKHNLPLADYHAACLRARPGNAWDGTIISKDGVHPSGGKTNLYSEINLKTSGYALRNWVNFLVLRRLHFRVFEHQPE
jgi:lysophospholipase L1-like esterase